MIKYLLSAFILLTVFEIDAQTLIATSNHPEATANHNQRKIVRDSLDNVYVIFVDTINQENVIKGIMYDRFAGLWDTTVYITNGCNPTIAIEKSGKIHMIYESNDSITRIKHICSTDFNSWTSNIVISDTSIKCKTPVSDIDSLGYLNIFWVQKIDSLNESLIYACINGDTLYEKKLITTKALIKDVAIANHLQYIRNDLFFAIQFNLDSIQFFRSNNNMNSYDTIYTSIGSQPGITFNTPWGTIPDDNILRFIYINPTYQLMEVQSHMPDFAYIQENYLNPGQTDYVCVDNIAPEIGYSYLFMQNGNLYHGFSYGMLSNIVLDTIATNPIHPSIAYKHFNFFYIDYIWMEDNGSGYNIFHKRDDKHIWVSIEDNDTEKDFSIIGYPNPFTDYLNITVSSDDKESEPIIQIYNIKSQLVSVLTVEHIEGNEYNYKWNGTNINGEKVETGKYIILCTVGNKKTARKVIYIN